ncbi:MAG: hypothetical protein J6K82_02270 [Alphaproteobacteria bacterium]|nr:hypothetical protein [Alphaproteobacteria bacterium]
MKHFKRFLLCVFCVLPSLAGAQVATTAGSNLTAWNGNSGATNNNNWNQMMNSRTQATGAVGAAPKADFGNCNSLILRCAQPKCAACTSLDLARPIVAGCVNSNDTCKKHGDDLIEFISAQIVANAASKQQEQQLAAQQAAAQAAAAQNNAQMQQMQQQMAQMQQQMQQQSAQQMAQMQAALEEQKQLVAAAQAEAAAAAAAQATANASPVVATDDLVAAVSSGVDADLMARHEITGQILTEIENAEIQMKTLKATMDDIFKYAGCDPRGNNCAGPKRIKMFKDKTPLFFEEYDAVVDSAYEALETALAVGADVSDVVMMLSGACNKWGKFLCTGSGEKHEVAYYTSDSCSNNGRSIKNGMAKTRKGGNANVETVAVKGGMECSVGMAVPPQDDVRCTLTGFITDGAEEVQREWVSEAYDGDRLVRVGCATSALDTISIFGRRRSRKDGGMLDLDVLERIILQDAPEFATSNRFRSSTGDKDVERLKYCAMSEKGYQTLDAAIKAKKMPARICVDYDKLAQNYVTDGVIIATDGSYGNSEILAGINSCDECLRYRNNMRYGQECNIHWRVDWVATSPENKGTEQCPASCADCGKDVIGKDGYTTETRCVFDTTKCVFDREELVVPNTKKNSGGSLQSGGGNLPSGATSTTSVTGMADLCKSRGGVWSSGLCTCPFGSKKVVNLSKWNDKCETGVGGSFFTSGLNALGSVTK